MPSHGTEWAPQNSTDLLQHELILNLPSGSVTLLWYATKSDSMKLMDIIHREQLLAQSMVDVASLESALKNQTFARYS